MLDEEVEPYQGPCLRARSWTSLTGSWGEDTVYCIINLENIYRKKINIGIEPFFNLILIKELGDRLTVNFVSEIMDQNSTPSRRYMVEPS